MISEYEYLYWPELHDNGIGVATRLKSVKYICGYCGILVSSDKGYPLYSLRKDRYSNNRESGLLGGVFICSNCESPTFIFDDKQIPGPIIGSDIKFLPDQIEEIYNEIRKNISNNAHTSAVLLSRKLLMHIAVEEGAQENLKFVEYINYLEENNFLPPKSYNWVDKIREKGNEANHEIIIMTNEDSRILLIFIEMILRYIYMFPQYIEE